MIRALAIILYCGMASTSFAQRGRVADTATYLAKIREELSTQWPANRTINIVFHGHSGPVGSWANHEVHTLESYPHQVLKSLKQMYPYAVINVIVTAIGGENAVSGARRFSQDVLTQRPDVLVIDYAANDFSSGLDSSKVAWSSMIERALALGIRIILVTPGNDQRRDILEHGGPFELHAQQVRQLAAQYGLALADPFAKVQQLARSGHLKEYMSFINHFNEKGHAIYCAEIIKWFLP